MPYNSQPSIDPGNKFSRGDGKIQFSLNLYPKSIYILSRGNQIARVYEQAINLPQPQPLVLPFVTIRGHSSTRQWTNTFISHNQPPDSMCFGFSCTVHH